MAYRLMTAGAVFIPEAGARSWHQGEPAYVSRSAEVRRANAPDFANYVPVPGRFRPKSAGRQYEVPLVAVIVKADADYDVTKACVNAILAGEETDLRVHLWRSEADDGLELLRAEYRGDARVRVGTQQPATGFPSRFTVFMPAHAGFGAQSLSAMLDLVERAQLGVLHVAADDLSDLAVAVLRTAALHRARRAAQPEDAWAAAGQLFGERSISAAEVGIVDLRQPQGASIAAPKTRTRGAEQQLARTERKLADLRRRHAALRRDYEELARTTGQPPLQRRPGRRRAGWLARLRTALFN